jgi:hypothetical protein
MNMELEKHEPEPVRGWICAAVGIGFVIFLVAAIACVIKIGGNYG